MDVYTTKRDLRFVWDSDKAAINVAKHGISFDRACEAFFDPFYLYEDASVDEEQRLALIGRDFSTALLYVVHVVREDERIRIISAWAAGAAERRNYYEEA